MYFFWHYYHKVLEPEDCSNYFCTQCLGFIFSKILIVKSRFRFEEISCICPYLFVPLDFKPHNLVPAERAPLCVNRGNQCAKESGYGAQKVQNVYLVQIKSWFGTSLKGHHRAVTSRGVPGICVRHILAPPHWQA